MKLKYESISKIKKLLLAFELNFPNSCFDDVHEIEFNNDRNWRVTIFVEPVGEFVIQNNEIDKIFEFLLELFQSQPADWDYLKAGYHLDSVYPTRLIDLALKLNSATDVWEMGNP